MQITPICKDACWGYNIGMMFHGNPADKSEAMQSRRKYYFRLAKELGVDKKFVQDLLTKEAKQILGSRRLDLGSKIRTKAGIYKKKRQNTFDTKSIAKNMAKIVTRKQECTAKIHPLCLKVFITNKEDTV